MSGIGATMRAAFGEARANRRAFWTQVTVMVTNDVAWVLFWTLFFGEVRSVRGWDRSDVLLLLAVVTTGAGVVLALLSNSRRIGQLIADGGIDAALALPVAPLPYLLVRRVEPVNFGDLAFGLVLFALSGPPSLDRTAIYLVGAGAGALVFVGFLVMIGSLAFFAGRGEVGDLGFQALILLAQYPTDLFGATTKVVLYTAVPAAFVSAVPARLVEDFSWGAAGGLGIAAATFAIGGWAAFTLGLRRYTSSAVWTRA